MTMTPEEEIRDLKSQIEIQARELERHRKGTYSMDAKRLGALFLGLPWQSKGPLRWTSVPSEAVCFAEAQIIAVRLVGDDVVAAARGTADWR